MRIAIVGAGPCGLACARELQRHGHDDWLILERATTVGGSAGSVMDANGFTWDYGGHVVFSHFGEFDALLKEVMDGELLEHERSSYIRFDDRWVPYPFQNNLRQLPEEIACECLAGFLGAHGASRQEANFGDWMEATFGAGISRHFLRPYNRKLWTTEPEAMSHRWIAERVSVPDTRQVLANFLLGRDDRGWGPNSTFLFPAHGGTGEIYRRVATELERGIRLQSEVVRVDADNRVLELASGAMEYYDVLVSTMPLDRLVAALHACPSDVLVAGRALKHNSVMVVGVGYELPLSDDRSWLYFPDPATPFYRATNFAKYAPSNVPGARTSRYSSYMTETSHRPDERLSVSALQERVVEALSREGVVPAQAPIASVHAIELEYAYPIPTLDRDRALRVIHSWLSLRDIHSRGRFGGWRYEAGNMDHAVKSGIDIARRLLEGRPEAFGSP